MALNVTDVTYTWYFNTLTCYPTASGHTDVVCKTLYTLTATTGSYSVSGSTMAYQDFPLPTSGPFIPFEDLTPEIITGWVEAAMGKVYLYKIKKDLANQLENKIFPPTENKTPPWILPPSSSSP